MATEKRDQSYERLTEGRNFQKGLYEEQFMEGEPTIADKAKIYLDILGNEIMEAKYKVKTYYP